MSTLDAMQREGGARAGSLPLPPPLPNSPTPALGELWRDARDKDETIANLRGDLARMQRERDDAVAALARERDALRMREAELEETKGGLERALATAKELREKITVGAKGGSAATTTGSDTN